MSSSLSESDEEMSRKADVCRRELLTIKAMADAISCTAKQKFDSLMEEYSKQMTELHKMVEQRNLVISEKDDEVERLRNEVAELRKSRSQLMEMVSEKDDDAKGLSTVVAELRRSQRQLLEMVEQRDLVISERDATVRAHLDSIKELTETKKELENNAQTLKLDCELRLKNAVKQGEEMTKELANALRVITNPENRTAAAELGLSIEKSLKSLLAKAQSLASVGTCMEPSEIDSVENVIAAKPVSCSCSKNSLCKKKPIYGCRAAGGHCGTSCSCDPSVCCNRGGPESH